MPGGKMGIDRMPAAMLEYICKGSFRARRAGNKPKKIQEGTIKMKFTGDAEQLQSQLKKYQRRLIPANIVVVILAVAVALCQIFMPMIKIDVTINSEVIAIVMENMEQSGDGQTSGEEAIPAGAVEYVLKDVNAGITLEIEPLGAMQLGPTPEAAAVRDYITENAGDLTASLDVIMQQAMPRLAAYMIISASGDQSALESDADTSELTAVMQLLNEGEYEQAKADFTPAARNFAQSIGYTLSDENAESLSQMFSDIVDAGRRDDGSFSYVDAIGSLAGEEGGEIPPELSDITGTMENMLAEIPDETMCTTGTGIFIVAAGLIGVTSALWLLMALIAFLRIFARNRRFTMWYVKLLCWLPCFVCVAAPMLAITLAPSLVAGMAPEAAASAALLDIPMAFGGSGIVSGIGYAVLWLISIFWCYPIKRKIRRLNKSL